MYVLSVQCYAHEALDYGANIGSSSELSVREANASNVATTNRPLLRAFIQDSRGGQLIRSFLVYCYIAERDSLSDL